MVQIRIATTDDYYQVIDFYYSLIDELKDAKYSPGWKKDIYPTQEFIIHSIENKQLYIGEQDGQIASCMVVNHEYNEGYKDVRWSINVKELELFVIHALGVRQVFSGNGIAKQMVQHVIKIAQESSLKTIRLDVLSGNLPAEKAYMKIGFAYQGKTQMFYEDTGWTEYKLFEYII